MASIQENQILQFLFFQTEPFTIPEIIAYTRNQITKTSIQQVTDYIEAFQLAYPLNSEFEGFPEWISRAGLYIGEPVILIPTKAEIALGALLVGSRCVPFYNPTILPHKITLYFKNKKIKQKKIQLPYSEIYNHYQLFGEESFSEYLLIENDLNKDIIMNENFSGEETVKVTAFDLQDFYWKHNFIPGDRLVLTLFEWSTATFNVEILKAQDIPQKQEQFWKKTMTNAIHDSLKILGPGSCIEEQLSFAYYLTSNSGFSLGAVELSSLIQETDLFDYEPYGVEYRLWFKGEEIPAPEEWTLLTTPLQETAFDSLALKAKLPLAENLLYSFALDACFRKEKDASNLIQRIEQLRGAHNTKTLSKSLITEINKAYTEAYESYSLFLDNDLGPIRNKFVQIYIEMVNFILHIEHTGLQPIDFPKQLAIILTQLFYHCVSAMQSIDFPHDDEYHDFDLMWLSVESLEDYFFEIKTTMQEIIPSLLKQRLTLVKK